VERKKRRIRKSALVIGGIKHRFRAPGFKKADRGVDNTPDYYWQAADDAVEAGYPTKTVPLEIDFSDPASAVARIEQRCHELQAEMLTWLDGDRDDRARLAPQFVGTVESLVDCYMSDEDSAYALVQENTAEGYRSWFKMIRETVGKRLVARLVAKDLRRWYREWKKRTSRRGDDGTRTAYGGIQAVRMLLNYGIESGIKCCRTLRQDMDKIRFARSSPREETLSYAETKAVVTEALRRGLKNVALSQALQFECMLRQIDVIGKWTTVAPDYVPAPGEIVLRGKVWRGLTMEQIALDTSLRIRTSKTGQPVIHKTAACELVVLVLGAFGPGEWTGPVARRPDGTPFPDRQAYAKVFRKIANAVGIAPETQNRDSRASGISEQQEAGVPDDDIQRQSGHGGKAILRKTYERLGEDTSERSHAVVKIFRERKSAQRGSRANSQALTVNHTESEP
jgi:hypothetical protein